MILIRRAPVSALFFLAVACGGDGTGPDTTPGGIRVTTVGSGPGAVFHGLYIDGVQDEAIGASAERLIEDLAPGTYSVGLATVTANCATGPNPREVSVAGGLVSPVTFTVTCAEPAAETGTIAIELETTGTEPDPDGYAVAVDGVTQAGPLNGSFAIGLVPAGTRTVELLDVAQGCAVAQSAERTVELQSNSTSTERFEVTCGAP